MQTTSENTSNDHVKSKVKITNNRVQTSQLMELFEEKLKVILWTEKELTTIIPKMITLATSDDLILALTDHLHQTNEHITRLAKVFKTIDKKPATFKSNVMDGLIAEAGEIMEDCDKGPKCDAAIIAATQKIEHYEIATYGTLREYAETLNLREAERLLLKTLNEEKEADKKLTEVAVQSVNVEAASEKM